MYSFSNRLPNNMFKELFFSSPFRLNSIHIKYLILSLFLVITFNSGANVIVDSKSEGLNEVHSNSNSNNNLLYAGNDTIICSGGSITLKASGLENLVNYTWYRRDVGGLVNLGTTNPLIINPGPNQTTTYIIAGDDSPTDKDSLVVKVCLVNGFTANPTCSGQLYSVAGNITYSSPPSTGTMTVSIGTKTQTFNAPFGASTKP